MSLSLSSSTFLISFPCLLISWPSPLALAFASGLEDTNDEHDYYWLLDEFKNAVGHLIEVEFMNEDGYLLRWLRVADYDVDEAVKRFTETLDWRKQNVNETLLEEDFSRFNQAYPYWIDGFDKHGHPIVWGPVGTYNFRQITLAGLGEVAAFRRYIIRMLELGEIVLFELGKRSPYRNVSQLIGVADLGGFSMARAACLRCVEQIPEIMYIFQTHYPLMFNKMFLINVPAVFSKVLAIAQPFLSHHTQAAVTFLDLNKDKWSRALLEQIPSDQLRIEYGGGKSWSKSELQVKGKQADRLLEWLKMPVEYKANDMDLSKFGLEMPKIKSPMAKVKVMELPASLLASSSVTSATLKVPEKNHSIAQTQSQARQRHHHHYTRHRSPTATAASVDPPSLSLILITIYLLAGLSVSFKSQ